MNATPTPPPDGIDEPISRARETATTAADQAIQKWRSVRSACFRIFWILMGLVILSAAASKVLTARGGTADGLAIAMIVLLCAGFVMFALAAYATVRFVKAKQTRDLIERGIDFDR